MNSSRPSSLLSVARRAALCAIMLGVAPWTLAADYPTRPVRLVVPFGAGTNTDILARALADRLAPRLGQALVVDNRAGAGGNVGADFVSKAAPDGYTLLFGAASVLSINSSLYSGMPFDSATAFAPIAQVASVNNVLVADPALPLANVRDLVSYAKSNPGKLNFASAGAGGSVHLSGELFKSVANVDLVHVQYKSSPAAHMDMIGGRVQLMFDGLPSVLPQITSGKLRPLAVTGPARSPLLPAVPTVAESGLPGYEVVGWFGVVAPAGTPKAIVDQLNREINAVLSTPDMKQALARLGADPATGSSEQFGAFIKSEALRWSKLIRDAGIKLN